MKENLFVYGLNTIRVMLTIHPDRVLKLICNQNTQNTRIEEIIEQAKKENIHIEFWDNTRFNDFGDFHKQKLVAECKNFPAFSERDLVDIIGEDQAVNIVILDEITDPHNLGAILRVAGAMNVTCVIATKNNASSITPVVRKVACGGAEAVPFVQVVNLSRVIKFLKEKNIWIYGTKASTSNKLYQYKFPNRMALVFGSEGRGLRHLTEKMCDDLISLPLNSVIESLNVSVATGIFLYEALRQQILKS